MVKRLLLVTSLVLGSSSAFCANSSFIDKIKKGFWSAEYVFFQLPAVKLGNGVKALGQLINGSQEKQPEIPASDNYLAAVDKVDEIKDANGNITTAFQAAKQPVGTPAVPKVAAIPCTALNARISSAVMIFAVLGVAYKIVAPYFAAEEVEVDVEEVDGEEVN